MNNNIAVYLFTGFLEAGKTTLLRDTLADSRFQEKERTLVLLCEEGEEELDLRDISGEVAVEVIDTRARLNPDKLAALQRKHKAERVMLEYNGMWQLSDLFAALPENWFVYQEIMLADASTFATYNANMRSLVVDKLGSAEMVVFNRFTGGDEEKMALHKIVRGISRSANIIYERPDRTLEYDEIEDPLPFDIEADVIEIADRDFAIWFRDMSEDMEKYRSKTLRFRGIVARDTKLPADSYVVGRHVMTCCADDIAYRGLICQGKGKCPLEARDWIVLTARLDIEKHKLYGGVGPVLKEISYEKCEPLPREEQVATFY